MFPKNETRDRYLIEIACASVCCIQMHSIYPEGFARVNVNPKSRRDICLFNRQSSMLVDAVNTTESGYMLYEGLN